MPKLKQTPLVSPDFSKPVLVAGVFLIFYAIINGAFMLVNTKLKQQFSSPNSNLEAQLVSAKLIEMKAKVLVDARETWQTTGLFIEKGVTVQMKVLDGEWTEWLGVRKYNSGDGSDYICAQTIQAEKCVEPVPDFASGALIGRVGRQTLKISADGKFTANASGVLQLRINDGDQGLYDNKGMLTVAISFFNR